MKFLNYATDRYIGAGEKSDEGDHSDKNVLVKNPVEGTEPSVPLVDGVNDGGSEQAETGQKDGTAEVDEEFQIGECSSKGNC